MATDLQKTYSPDDLRELFSDYIARGALADGATFFQRIVARNPDYGLAWNLLGRLQEANGHGEEAYHAFYQAALTSERSTKVPTSAKVSNFLNLAKFCLRRGWAERAERHLDEVLLLAPGHKEARSLRQQLSKSTSAALPGHILPQTKAERTERLRHLTAVPITPSKAPTAMALRRKAAAKGPEGDKGKELSRLMGRAHIAFTRGHLQEAEELYRQAIEENPRHSGAYVSLAQTYNRSGDLEQMEQVLLEALGHPIDNEIAVLQTLGQLYMKKGMHHEVVDTYRKIVKKARSDSQKVGAYQWIGRGYAGLGEYDRARQAYLAALELAPTHHHTQTLLRKLDRIQAVARGEVAPVAPVSAEEPGLLEDEEISAWGEDEESVLEVETPGISLMLEEDAKRHSWSDPMIVARGGIVHLEDARRLMQNAVSTQEDFGTRALLFLEAAKTFGALDESERDPNQHQEALQRYASQIGGHYLLQLVGEIKRHPQTRTDQSRWLRDAACAYYVEAMDILQRRKPYFMFFILQQYLKALLLLELEPEEAERIFGSLDSNWGLDVILDRAADHPVPTVLETVLRGILELGRAQMSLVRKVYDSQEVKQAIKRHRERWRNALMKLGARSRVRRIPDAMRSVINTWRNAERAARHEFSEVYNYPVTLDNIADVRVGLEELLTFEGVFSGSDKELLRDMIDNILSQLVRYGELPRSSSAERELLAERARQRIRELRERISNYPTYWGRVYFDALLHRWERLLGRAEEARLAEIQPELMVCLENKRLPFSEPVSTLVFSVTNSGQATALNTLFHLLVDEESCECDENTVDLGNIAPGSSVTAQVRVRLPTDRESLKFLSVRYGVSYLSADGREPLPVGEDAVHFGEFRRIEHNPFNETPPVTDPDMFKGREELLGWLASKLKSEERIRSTLLYGLTRTGKTSILLQLQRRVLFEPVEIAGADRSLRLLPLLLSFDRCTRDRVEDFHSAVFEAVREQLDELAVKHPEHAEALPKIDPTGLPKSLTGLEQIIKALHRAHYYPIFLIDEFTIYRQMFDRGVLDASFLSRLRYFSINERVASFVYAGTYDLKALTSDPAYGITGQFVATDERQVGRISGEAARELVKVIEEQLYFSDTAVEDILFLSGHIPYFIQMICKNCVYYANQHETPSITPVELEAVVGLLASREGRADRTSQIKPISAGAFTANVWSRSDPVLTTGVLAALAFHPHAGRKDVYLSMDQIEGMFRTHRASFVHRELVDTLDDLANKQILEIQHSFAGDVEYRISVDLFRRWFVHHHSLEWAMGRLRGEADGVY
jgi:tetratricopeptide (TPR) repeat protein